MNKFDKVLTAIAFLSLAFTAGMIWGRVAQVKIDLECKNPEMLFSAEGTNPEFWVYKCDGDKGVEVKAYRWPLESSTESVTR